MTKNTIVYSIDDNPQSAKTLYINLTNKCTNNCIFCIRACTDEIKGKNLWLQDENISLKDFKEQIKEFNNFKEIVFCGYGEPFVKLDLLKEISKYLKENYNVKIRVNTNGHGNFINKKNIIPELQGLVDELSVSLNSSNETQYNEITQTKVKNAYKEVKDFIKKSIEGGIITIVSVVDEHPDYKLDLVECEKIANELKTKLKIRKWLNNGY